MRIPALGKIVMDAKLAETKQIGIEYKPDWAAKAK